MPLLRPTLGSCLLSDEAQISRSLRQDRIDGKYKHKCFEYTKRVYNYIENNPHIKYVILSGRWAIWIEGTRFDNKEGGVEYGTKVQLEWLKIKNFFLTINT